MDPDVAKVMNDVELHRGELKRIRRELKETVAETLELSGVTGMWSKLTGSYEAKVKAAEEKVTLLRMEQQITEDALRVSEASLAAEREAAAARAAEREQTSSEPGREQVSASVAGGGDVGQRLLLMEELEQEVRSLQRTARRLASEARTSSSRNNQFADRRPGHALVKQIVNTARAAQHNSSLASAVATWEAEASRAEALANQMDLELMLPRAGGAQASLAEGSSHRIADFTGLAAFASALERVDPELEGFLELLREGHRGLRRTGPQPASPPSEATTSSTGPSHAELQALQSSWARLFAAATALEGVCRPGASTKQLLGPVAAWNREAQVAAQLAEVLGIDLRPPRNTGGDLVGFITTLLAQLPELREAVTAVTGDMPAVQPRTVDAEPRAAKQANRRVGDPRTVPPGTSADNHLAALQALEGMVRSLKRKSRLLGDEAVRSSRMNRSEAKRRYNSLLVGQAVDDVRAGIHNRGLSELSAKWEDEAGLAEVLADKVGLVLVLPHAGASEAGMVYNGIEEFATALLSVEPQLEEVLEQLQDAQRHVRSRPTEGPAPTADAPAAVDPRRDDLRRSLRSLLEAGKAVKRVAVPGASTIDLLGPVGAWNREAAVVAELAEELGIELSPPQNQGGDLQGFAGILVAALPDLAASLAGLDG